MWFKTSIIVSLIFFISVPFFCYPQITDGFDNILLDTAIWKGDQEDFVVENGKLRLIAPSGKSRSLLYAKLSDLPKEVEWKMEFFLNFDPSNSNNLKIWLFAEDPEVENTDGYLFSIGETGSDDALIVQKIIDNQIFQLARGLDGNAAKTPSISINIVKDINDNWKITALHEGIGNEIITFVDEEIEILNGYFAIECNYTSTRSDKFFFDNIYIGPRVIDLISPTLEEHIINDNGLDLVFNEAISQSTTGIENFLFDPEFTLVNISFPSINKINLEGDESFESNTNYRLSLSGIMDLSGNELDTVITFFIAAEPLAGELLVNEILFNPKGSGSDFVEIINKTDKVISLANLYLGNTSNNRRNRIESPVSIQPNEILVFTGNKDNIIQEFESNNALQIFEQDIPSFNNDKGNVSIGYLIDNEFLLLDGYDYSEKDHIVVLDDEDGVSLERISLDTETQNTSNWTSASSLVGFGTPGLPNSVAKSENIIGLEEITVTNKVFSPNGDGVDDEAEVEFSLLSTFIVNATIYDLNGKIVKRIWKNETTPLQGKLSWNGRNENEALANTGIYILILEFFDIEGRVIRHKEDLVLAEQLD